VPVSDRGVQVVDAGSAAVVRELALADSDETMAAVAVDARRGWVYAAGVRQNMTVTLQRIDGAAVTTTPLAGTDAGFVINPVAMAADEVRGVVYAFTSIPDAAARVFTVDGASDQVVATLDLAGTPLWMKLDAAGDQLLAATEEGQTYTIHVLALPALAERAPIALADRAGDADLDSGRLLIVGPRTYVAAAPSWRCQAVEDDFPSNKILGRLDDHGDGVIDAWVYSLDHPYVYNVRQSSADCASAAPDTH
jgi:hypothetical protein